MEKTYICAECGTNYTDQVETYGADNDIFIGTNYCTTCSFWMEKVKWRDDGDHHRVIVNGNHYYIGSFCPHIGRGFSGNFWIIEFNNGLIVGCRDLWCQGTIAPRFINRLPDNAKFLYKPGKRSKAMLEEGWRLKRVGNMFNCIAPGEERVSKVFKDGVMTSNH